METILYYAVEKRFTAEDGRLAEHETIVCSGTEIECLYRIRDIKKLQSGHSSAGDEAELTEGGIQIDPEYFVVEAEKYDKEHSLKEQRSIMSKFFSEFGGKL